MSPAYRTAEQDRAEYIARMGEDLGAEFKALSDEVSWLHMKWGQYVELYGTKPSRLEILNRAAKSFFWMIEKTLWEDTVLHVARLLDSPKSTGKHNLTLLRLPALVDPKLREEVTKLVEVAVEKGRFCRDWRHRRLAHHDLMLAMKKGATPLAKASRADVKDALASIANVLNAVEGHYRNAEVIFEGPMTNGAVDLLYVLDDGIRVEDARQDRIRRREYLPEDVHGPGRDL